MCFAGLGLWFVQSHRLLVFAQQQVAEAWAELRAALALRRETVPYIVAAVQVNAQQIVEVIGNACDLASHAAGVRECFQAEARLSAAIGRLFAALDGVATPGAGETAARLRQRMAEHEARVAVLAEAYNRRADTFNTLLTRGPARVFAHLAVFRAAELFA